MPLLKDEIVPGVVAYLDTAALVRDTQMKRTGGGREFRPGPYLCVQVKDGDAIWLPITSRPDERGLRLKLEQEWKIDGSDYWQREDQYIQDARKPFIGPVDSFVVAAKAELSPHHHRRAYVSKEGLAAVEKEMREYGVRLPLDVVN